MQKNGYVTFTRYNQTGYRGIVYRLQKPAMFNFYNSYKLVAAVGMAQELSGLAAVKPDYTEMEDESRCLKRLLTITDNKILRISGFS